MRKREKYTYEATRQAEVRCDRCGASARNDENLPAPAGHGGNTREVKIEAKTGDSWAESGHGTRWDLDLCTKCFVEWLVPLFGEHGIEVREEEWDY